MFRYSRPHPHVHILRRHGYRAVRRVVAGAALILLGIGCLLKSQGLISRDELWLLLPGVEPGRRLRNVFTGEEVMTAEHEGQTTVLAAEVFASFPVALLL